MTVLSLYILYIKEILIIKKKTQKAAFYKLNDS